MYIYKYRVNPFIYIGRYREPEALAPHRVTSLAARYLEKKTHRFF